MKDWWKNFFNAEFSQLWLKCDPERMQRVVNFICGALALKAGDAVFDQCCRTGEVSFALAAKGIRTFGVDYNSNYIKLAKENAKRLGASCEFIEGDAREYCPEIKCNAAINWYSSFGFFDENAENQKMLDRVANSIGPKRTALHFTNLTLIRKLAIHLLLLIILFGKKKSAGSLQMQWA